jgi:hypothetical protein
VVECYGFVLKVQGFSGSRELEMEKSFVQICTKLGLTWISRILTSVVVSMV